MSEPWRTWMPLDIGRYLTNTGHLSTMEHGAYLLLIMHYWTTGSLPQEDKKLAAIAKLTGRQWAGIRTTIAEFFRSDWTHKTVDEQLGLAEEKYRKRARAGHIGGAARAQHERDKRDHDSEAGQEQSSSNATADAEQSSDNAVAKRKHITHTMTSSNEEGWESARERVVQAFIVAGSPFIPDTSWVGVWKSRNYDPEVCLSVVRSLLQRNSAVRTLKYFDGEIASAHAPPPAGRARASPSPRFNDGRHQLLAEIQEARDEQERSRDRDNQETTEPPDGGNVHRIERAG